MDPSKPTRVPSDEEAPSPTSAWDHSPHEMHGPGRYGKLGSDAKDLDLGASVTSMKDVTAEECDKEPVPALSEEKAMKAAGGDVVVPVTADGTPGTARQSYFGILSQFGWMGWSAFGGPSAHIGLFQKVFVEKKKWLTSTVFLELLALCQFMPGPTSTQMSFAIGITQKGVRGGLLSGILFQYPGLLIAGLAGVGAANFLKDPKPWLRGLTDGGLAAVGVALVASSAKALTYSTCKDRVTMAINAGSAVVMLYYSPTWIFPLLLAVGGAITLYTRRKEVTKVEPADEVQKLGVPRWLGAVLVIGWVIILVVSILVRANTNYADAKLLHWWEAYFRIGSLIFGGGQVVLPMLDTAIVSKGWISSSDFYTGIALVQAMPGPLFNIAAYTGAIIASNAGVFDLWGIIVCWVALFGPGVLLIYGLLPWWAKFRSWNVYRRALPGLNAAAVGLIVGAVFQLGLKLRQQSPFPNATTCIGIIGFAMVDFLNVPAPLAVAVGGVLGVIGWATGMH